MRTVGTTTLALKLHARQKKELLVRCLAQWLVRWRPAPLEGTPVRSETGHVPTAMQAGRCPRTPPRGAAPPQRGPAAHFYPIGPPPSSFSMNSGHFGNAGSQNPVMSS